MKCPDPEDQCEIKESTGETLWCSFHYHQLMKEVGDVEYLHEVDAETCTHGLSAVLCADPNNHYEPDNIDF